MDNLSHKISNNKLTSFLILAFFFTLPFERIPTIDVAGFTLKISYVLAVTLLATFLFCRPVQYFKKNPLTFSDWLLILFWLMAIVSFPWSDFKTRGMVILLLWAFVFLTYFVLSRMITQKNRVGIENTILLVTAFVCIFGIFQFIGDSLNLSQHFTGLRLAYTKSILGFPRIQSIALEPLYFANFLMVPFFLSIKRYIQDKKSSLKYWLLSVLILVNIVLTVSRGAYIAVAITLAILIIYLIYKYRQKEYLKKILGVTFIVIVSITFSVSLVYSLNGKKAASGLVSHSAVAGGNISADGSALDRIGGYKIALNLFKSRPIFGIGTSYFGIKTTDSTQVSKAGYGVVNNEYLEILTENGIVGLMLFMAFLILLFFESYKAIKKTLSGTLKLDILILFLGIFAILIQYNFFSTLYIIYIWTFLALLKNYTFSGQS